MDLDSVEIASSTEPTEPCWPFWGLLEAHEKDACSNGGAAQSRIYFRSGKSDLFDRFQSIGMQALRMLQGIGPNNC